MALKGAAGLVALLILTWIAAFHIAAAERLDRSILQGFAGIGFHPRVSSVATTIAGTLAAVAAVALLSALTRLKTRQAGSNGGRVQPAQARRISRSRRR